MTVTDSQVVQRLANAVVMVEEWAATPGTVRRGYLYIEHIGVNVRLIDETRHPTVQKHMLVAWECILDSGVNPFGPLQMAFDGIDKHPTRRHHKPKGKTDNGN